MTPSLTLLAVSMIVGAAAFGLRHLGTTHHRLAATYGDGVIAALEARTARRYDLAAFTLLGAATLASTAGLVLRLTVIS